MKKLIIPLLFVIGLTTFYGCHDNDKSASNATVGFYLTDAPAPFSYKAVNVDVQGVSYSLDGNGWTNLLITPRVIDLLRFSNGQDTLLSNITLEAGVRVQQIRLLLGDNNTLTLNDGSVVQLGTPSGQTSGLKINVTSAVEVTSGYKVVIDFDAARSIVAKGNGTYSLKPVIRAFIEANTSSVSGNLTPSNRITRVFTVTSAGDTISTVSDTARNNYFMLQGLFSGTYNIQAENPANGPLTTLKPNLNVIGGTNINLGVIALPELPQ